MQIITVDGKRWNIKLKQNAESVTVNHPFSATMYPNFIGTKMKQNSTSSDIYNITFSVHRTNYVGFKESFKKFVNNEEDAIDDQEYGKLTHIIFVHDTWGAIHGLVKGDVNYGTSSDADILITCTFQEHTRDEPIEKKDIEQENSDAEDDIDTETNIGELEEADRPALLQFLDNMKALYANIQNSEVIAALNDLESAINSALLDYQKVMNSVKKVLALPSSLLTNIRGKLDFFKKQAEAIKNIPVSTFNLARFNMNCLSFNLGQTNRTPFISESARQASSGVKVAPIK